MRIRYYSLFIIILLATACMPITPNSNPATANQEAITRVQPMEVTVWSVSLGYTLEETLRTNRNVIAEVNPVWYQLGNNGTLRGSGTSLATVQKLQALGIRVVPSIQNSGFNRDNVYAAIHEPENRARHIDEIVKLVVENNYDGIDIDYESLAAEDREDYSQFMESLAVALHQQDKLLSTAVHPKTDDKSTWGGPQAQDWARIGAAVDAFKIMTYDYHWSTSEAGPIAPLTWVDEVLDYAATQLPPEKTYLGVHFYGYDWLNSKAEGLEWVQIQSRIQRHNGTIQRSEPGEAMFDYTVGGTKRTVYFMDALALGERLDYLLVRHPQLAGIAIWRVGGEDPENWSVIQSEFATNK